jgi:hypothetical protein
MLFCFRLDDRGSLSDIFGRETYRNVKKQEAKRQNLVTTNRSKQHATLCGFFGKCYDPVRSSHCIALAARKWSWPNRVTVTAVPRGTEENHKKL